MTENVGESRSQAARLLRSVRNVFLAGVLAILPLYLTIVAVKALFQIVDASTADLVELVFGYRFPGLGFVATILVVFAIGLLVSQVGFNRFGSAIDRVFKRVPGIGKLYGAIRTLLDPLSHPETRPFREAVWVDVGQGMHLLGFITSAPFLEDASGQERVNVYLPMTHPYVGFVVTLPEDRLRPCPAAFDEVVSYHFSCGSALPRHYRAHASPVVEPPEEPRP